MGQKPECMLCPNKGGAMKSTRSGQKWAHVSCALWIPEVSIGSVDRMEPITKISSIPPSRWALVCVLCRERVGACIQCSVKTCKTAYHVTCAFQHGLEMRAIIEDENAEDGVKLRSYCQKHSVKKEPKTSANAEKPSGSTSDDEEKVVLNKKKVRKEMTTEERNHARLARLVEIQSEFEKHVNVKDISCHLLDVDQEGINYIYNYWILKRRAGGNDPLLLPKTGDVDVLSQTDQEQADIEKMKMFVHLRQDLERVRNLCYMVSRREKLSRSFFKMREQIFHKQLAVLSSYKKTNKHFENSITATMEANHGPSIYDVLYSSDSVKDSKVLKIEEMIDSILNNSTSNNEINGNAKKEKLDAVSRYSKLFNGGNTGSIASNKKLKNIYESLSSETEDSARRPVRRKNHRNTSSMSVSLASSSEDESPTRKSSITHNNLLPPPPLPNTTPTTQPKKKGRPPGSTKQAVAEKRKLLNAINAKDKPKSMSLDTSSEEDVRHSARTLLKSPIISSSRLPSHDDQMHLTDESDELVPIRNSSGHSIPTTGNAKRIHSSAIYSDSDSSSTDKDNKTDHTVSDSQQQPFRTKAAMKEFNINDLLPFEKSKKITDILGTKQNNIPQRKTVKSPEVLKSRKLVAVKKEASIKTRRLSSKPSAIHSSDSEPEDILLSSSKDGVKDKKESEKKDVIPDFLVVPQREAAKKASENLMKTNSALMVQSISGTASEKNRREIREKLDETVLSSKLIPCEIDRENQKEIKSKLSKSSKESKKAAIKDDSKTNIKKHQKEESEKEKEKEDKFHQEFSTDFLPYVPQRQAAKKAAEHIKGLGNSSQPLTLPTEDKLKVPIAPIKKGLDPKNSSAIDLSSSSTSSSSSDSVSSSDSESEKDSLKPAKQAPAPKLTAKTVPTRRSSIAVALKPKPKDSPFLDKVAKSSTMVESSSSSSSSDSDSTSSDRVDTSRLPKKENTNKRRNQENSSKPKSITPSSKKTATNIKKEIDKPPTRRLSTVVKTPQLPASNQIKTATSNRPSQKSVTESTTASESQAASRKRSSSTTTTPSKVSSDNKSRASESSKGDLVKLPNKRQTVADIKFDVMSPPTSKSSAESSKKRKPSTSSVALESAKEQQNQKLKSEVEKETVLRRSSRSENSTTKAPLESIPEKSQTKYEKNERLSESETKIDSENSFKDFSKESQNNITSLSSTATKKSSDVIEIVDEPENEQPKVNKLELNQLLKIEDSVGSRLSVNSSDVQMISDETLEKDPKIISSETKHSDVKDNIVKPSLDPGTLPMVSIPTANLNNIITTHNNESPDDAFNKVLHEDSLFENSSSNFTIPKIADKEETERATLNLIEKLRQKNKKIHNALNIGDNNNITHESIKPTSCSNQNENIISPRQDLLEQLPLPPVQQIQQHLNAAYKPVGSPTVLSKKDQEFNELKKSSPWHQPNQVAENNYQRNILTTNNNKINSTLDQTPSPASCMVIEQQQKLAACQKINEENNMLASNRGTNMFIPPIGINILNEQPNHMEIFNSQNQQQQLNQKWPKDQKTLNLKIMQQNSSIVGNVMKRSQPGMENMNMINDINQQAMKSFPQLPHKGTMNNDFSNDLHQPHHLQGNFNSYNYHENSSQFTGAVSLFPPADMNVQVPFPSPGQAMFAPNFSQYTTPHQSTADHSVMLQGGVLNKGNISDLGANNIRFGAQNFCSSVTLQQQIQTASNEISVLQKLQQKHTEISIDQLKPTDKIDSQKKSPSKSTRSSPRNSTPTHAGGKTPQKSPSKSPRQPSTPVSVELFSRQSSQKGKVTPNANETKQRKSRTNSQASPATTPADHRTNKGRGRGNKSNKGRFHQAGMPFIPFNSGIDYIAINKKLVGTVYDFSADDEFNQTPSVENLRAMRDRTKSVEVFNKVSRDGSSQSPKTTKASSKSIQHSSLLLNNHSLPGSIVNESTTLPVAPGIANLNLVNIPGPVDMRTYNSYDNTNDSYNSQLLGAFASNTVDQTLNDIDEEQEKELQTALKASNDKQKTPTTNTVLNTTETQLSIEMSSIVEESVDSEASFAKVSLSDSRNQLKLKIKGPLAHPDLHLHTISNPVVPLNIASNASNASSNRRQMRKKELLQQYWNQGANIALEQPHTQSVDQQVTSNTSRIGGIPKAVDSMGLGLLKDEFQDFNYAEYKKRKRFAISDTGASNISGLTSTSNDIDPLSLDYNKKRRNRANRGGQQQLSAMGTNPPPKLKIKIGSDIMETSGSDLPPKKRHIAAPPSYQDLKRESMDFRKKMMDEFSEQKSKEHRSKEEKREKKEKKKKKKEKKRSVEILTSAVAKGAPVKLILKIGNKSVSTVSSASAENSNSSELSKLAPPLKLKISRSSQGNGEYNILNARDPEKQVASVPADIPLVFSIDSSRPIMSSNNNIPTGVSTSDINSVSTKKLEISLERLEDVAKAKSALVKNNSNDAVPNEKSPISSAVSKDCEVR